MPSLIAQLEVPTYLAWALGAGGMVLAAGYLISTFKRGKIEGRLDVVTLYEKEVELLRGRVATLEAERSDCAQRIASLEGQIAQLTEQNHELRKLIMGESVPPALRQAMADIAKSNLEHYISELTELRREVMQGLARLLTAGASE